MSAVLAPNALHDPKVRERISPAAVRLFMRLSDLWQLAVVSIAPNNPGKARRSDHRGAVGWAKSFSEASPHSLTTAAILPTRSGLATWIRVGHERFKLPSVCMA